MRLPMGNPGFLNSLGRAGSMPVRPPQMRTPWGLDVPVELHGGGQMRPQPTPMPMPGPQNMPQNRQAMLMQMLRSSGRGARY